MAFYIQPPMGDITISQLENWAVKRLQFLLDIFGCHGNMDAVKQLMESPSSVEKSDCLIEGTTKDAVSHFILRLACAGDVQTAKVFVESETVLFLYRFTSLNEAELLRYVGCLRRFQKQLTKHFESVDPENVSLKLPAVVMDVCEFFKMLTETFDWRTLIHHYSLKSEEHFVRLPFKFALEMVSKRQVVLNRGKAIVPCRFLPQLFKWFFHSWLNYGIRLAKTQHGRFIEDSRMKRISAMCMSLVWRQSQHLDAGHITTVLGNLTAADIDQLVKGFPPCMIHLHESLRRNHRLKHYSRIVYILFLKELGLPVNEAISFWRQEYSQPFPVSSSYHGCRHSWHKDGRRLTYSIQHLYGFKGSRQKYRSHTCLYMQSHDWGPAEEAFCPFYHSDNLKLKQHLASELLPAAVLSRIHESVETKQPCMACSVFLEAKIEHHMPGTNEPCSDGISVDCCGKETSTTDKVLGSEKNVVLQTDINCGCAGDGMLPISTKSDSSSVYQFPELKYDDGVMMETDIHARLQPFMKRRANESLTHFLNIDGHKMPKPSAGLEKEIRCQKINFNQNDFSSENGFVLPVQHTEDSGYDSSPILNSREFEPDVLSSSARSGLCRGGQLVKEAIVLNPQGKACNLINCTIKTKCLSAAYRQQTQLAKKSTDAEDSLLRLAVETPKTVKHNIFNSERICSCRRKAHQTLETDINSGLNNQHKATDCSSVLKHQSSLKRAVVFELKKVVCKPVDFFQSYNDLVEQFRKESVIVLS